METRLVGNCMVAVDLTEGSHTVTFTYRNTAFSLGWKVTLVCFVIFGALVWAVYKPDLPGRKHSRQGKFQR